MEQQLKEELAPSDLRVVTIEEDTEIMPSPQFPFSSQRTDSFWSNHVVKCFFYLNGLTRFI